MQQSWDEWLDKKFKQHAYLITFLNLIRHPQLHMLPKIDIFNAQFLSDRV